MSRQLTVVFLVVALAFVGCAGSQPASPKEQGTLTAIGGRRDFGDFSLELPIGWSSVSPDREKTKCMLLLGGDRWTNAKAMIKVDVGSPTLPTPAEMAQTIAKSSGGHVLPQAVDLDGENGITVQTSSTTTLSTPREVIIVYRNGKVYLIMAGPLRRPMCQSPWSMSGRRGNGRTSPHVWPVRVYRSSMIRIPPAGTVIANKSFPASLDLRSSESVPSQMMLAWTGKYGTI